MWDAPANLRLFTPEAIEKAEKLINVVANAGLELVLPPRMRTHYHYVTKCWSRLDHVFLSEHLLDTLIACVARTSTLRIKTDHVPIVTELNFSVVRTPTKIIANFRDVDWDTFREKLKVKMANMGRAEPITSQQVLNTECDKLTKILQETIEAEVPKSELGTHAKRQIRRPETRSDSVEPQNPNPAK